mmetsp:Transcript_31612/g.64945  ORF Transcript_31612/g.64945 Transcript_31612/m.64945 type:complete len:259 (+) Transcript_31612:3-779(+)
MTQLRRPLSTLRSYIIIQEQSHYLIISNRQRIEKPPPHTLTSHFQTPTHVPGKANPSSPPRIHPTNSTHHSTMSIPADQQTTPIKKYQFVRRLKSRLARRRIRKEDEKILRAARDDATIQTEFDLPKTVKDALPDDAEKKNNDGRAIVVTECTGTFNMIGCNKAWENLCGYAECEIQGKDSSILQGPETNYDGLRDAVSRLFEGEQQATVVTTNYRKDGSRFKNLLTLGPLRDDNGKLTHFVAILKNIGDVKDAPKYH